MADGLKKDEVRIQRELEDGFEKFKREDLFGGRGVPRDSDVFRAAQQEYRKDLLDVLVKKRETSTQEHPAGDTSAQGYQAVRDELAGKAADCVWIWLSRLHTARRLSETR